MNMPRLILSVLPLIIFVILLLILAFLLKQCGDSQIEMQDHIYRRY